MLVSDGTTDTGEMTDNRLEYHDNELVQDANKYPSASYVTGLVYYISVCG